MIHAEKALQLPHAQPSKSDIDDAREVLKKLNDHIIKHMTLNGVAALSMPYRQMSPAAAQLVANAMNAFKWNINVQAEFEQSRFAGGAPVPDRWTITVKPMPEIYTAALADAVAAVIEGSTQQLDA